ncbi:serine-rich adhesin for platelets-like isoform X4 [Littorina saxatilis]|uniref:serine-rich adhesin for platelets-like isoform X4 n=1 Tax=Littorina saxatilis TaxID=31220 RepID=UPI0038B591F6
MATKVTLVSGTAEVKRRERIVEEPMMVASQGHMTGDRGNPYYTRQLDQIRSVGVEEPMMVATTGYMTGDKGNPYYSRILDERMQGGIESVPAAQPVSYVDGKCNCCPYGYHIDLDFLNFCKNVADGSTLSNLKRIQRTKRKLRKSMEVMLHQQHGGHGDYATATLSLAPTPPPDVVHSTEASRLINMVQYEQSATHQVLRDIDSSVNATLASIHTVQQGKEPGRGQRYMSSDSEDGYSYSPVSPASASSLNSHPQQQRYHAFASAQAPAPPPRRSSLHHSHHSNGDESSHFATSLSTSGRTDSLSSLSSVSTVSSEQVGGGQYTSHASGMLNSQPLEMATAQMRRSEFRPTTSATAMTSERLAATMATHFPQGEQDGRESPSSPMSPDTTIGKASLAAIREAMAVSLQRMRDLEEQVKAIPILQVRISVLKEEKRLLALQLKAKSSGTSASVRSVGVGEDRVDSSSVSPQAFAYPTASSPFAPLASSPRSPMVKSPPPTMPKPSRVKTVGVGEHSVIEPYLLQPHLPTGFTITDNQVENEIRTSIYEKEMVFGSLDRRLGSFNQRRGQQLSASEDILDTGAQGSPVQSTHFTINQIQRSAPKSMTRSVGVGEGNVHDTSLQIHEKELRTVIIGGSGGPVGKRNVGVEVRPTMRSVGVSYCCDDAKPQTRTIGVNVTYDMTNMHTSLDFKGEEELRLALRGVLQRNVRSVSTMCDFRPALTHTGVQHESFSNVSVGCGGEDCRVDVDIRQPVVQRSMGVTVKPDTANRTVGTEKGWALDMGTNTPSPEVYNKASNTENRRTGTVSTNTEQGLRRKTATQTDVRVFQSTDQLRSMGSNTIPSPTANSSSNTITPVTNHRGVNTKAPDLVMENFDLNIAFDQKASNTPREFRDISVNTSSRDSQLSLSKVECVDVAGEQVEGQPESPKRPLSMQEQILQRGASQASAFLGSTSSSGSPSPTSPGGKSALQDDASMSRTVTETVYTSPVTSRQVWSSQSGSGSGSGSSGGGSSFQTQVIRSSSGGGGGLLTSLDSDSSGGGGGGGGGFSRSTVTRTITSRGGSGGNFSSEGGQLLSGDFDTGDTSGGVSRSTVTKTITSRSGGLGSGGVVGGGRTGETKITKTVTTSGGEGTKTVTTSGGEGGSSTTTKLMTGPAFDEIDDEYTARKRAEMRGDLSGGSSYLERFGLGNMSHLGTVTTETFDTVTSETPQSHSLETDGGEEVSSTSLEVREGTASLQSAAVEPTPSGRVVMMGGRGGTEVVMGGGGGTDQVDSNSFSSTSSSSLLSSGQPDVVTETVVVKRSAPATSRPLKHRHSDGGRYSRDLAMEVQGAFSGRRVGSVEDFMPDDMRRLMNIEATGSGGKSRKSDKSSKNSRTVTTKKISQDGSAVIVTKTITNPDGTVTTTTTTDLDVDEMIPQGQGMGKLSTGRFDLSKLTDDDDSMMDSGTGDSQGSAEGLEGKGIKESGYYDSSSMKTVTQSSSMPGFDFESMGSLERRQLKSIMKKSKSDSANPKRGITFAESVVGGTGSSSEEADTESDDDSTTSFEEGSYDGREGDIIYQCRDDEAIAEGAPGATMYDQNIRETYELSEEMQKSCEVLASYLVDSTTIQTKELNANLAVVQQEWFRVSSHKLSSVHQVEDYLSSIKEISSRLLEYIVNLVDTNGNAAIHYCVSHGNFDIAGLLLDTEVCDVSRPNKAGYTPSMLAALSYVQNDDHRDIIRRLFAADDINAIAERTGQTALMLATSQCREDMVYLLLEAGADCNMQDFDGSTALMCACEHGHAAIAQMLLAQPGCDANLMDNENSTALSIAMEADHKDIGVILYKHVNFVKPASPEPRTLAVVEETPPPPPQPTTAAADTSPPAAAPQTAPHDTDSCPETEV